MIKKHFYRKRSNLNAPSVWIRSFRFFRVLLLSVCNEKLMKYLENEKYSAVYIHSCRIMFDP
jgi:hypothetical protein